jgi:acetyltransferase
LDSVLQYYAGVTHGPLRDVPVVSLDALHGELGFSGKIALDLVGCVVAVIDTKLATSLEETHAKSKELQFPIVLKSGDANSLHKTEKQLVRLNLRSPQQVEDAANELFGMGCASLLLQPQIEGVEVLIGVHRDEQLGHFLLVGLGGIWTEILDDVSIRPLGIGRSDALRMLENLRSFALLQGARGRPVVNLDSVVDAICGIDALARAVAPLIDSIDINPVIATNEGAWAVDAVLIRRPVQGGEHDNLSVCPILA